MAIKLNTILTEAGLNVVAVRLLRHKDKRALKGRTPYELWRDSPEQFALYQATQSFQNREKLKAEYWASFVATPAEETMFVDFLQTGILAYWKQTIQKHKSIMKKT